MAKPVSDMCNLLRKSLGSLLFSLLAPVFVQATNWYVDPAVAQNGNGTSWAASWNSVGAIGWSSVKPGDIVFLSGGSTSQTYTTPLTIGASGANGAPITIKAGQDAGHNGMVIFDGGGGTSPMINISSHAYITVDGGYGGSRHIVLQNNNLDSDDALLFASGDGVGNFLTGLVITSIEVKNSGSGIKINYPAGVEISDNYVHNIGCEVGIAVNGSVDMQAGTLWGKGAAIHDNTIQVNNQQQNQGIGPDAIQGTSGVDVYNNTITGALGQMNCSQHQDGFQFSGNYERVYGNYFYCIANSESEGDWVSKIDHTAGHYWFYNNTGGQCAAQSNSHGFESQVDGGAGVTALTDVRFYNNTWTDLTGYIAVRILGTAGIPVTAVEVKNNIVYNTSSIAQIDPGTYTCGSDVVIANNNINSGAHGGTGAVLCNGTAYAPTGTIAAAPAFKSYTEYGANNDLHLLTSSTADVGKGLSLTSISPLFSTDKDGVSRLPPNTWDLGAYEAGGGGATLAAPALQPPVVN
jgi:hypothetical protein